MFGLGCQPYDAAMSTKGERTRERILRVAETQLLEVAGRLEVPTVARAAEVSVGGLYHHFASKDELLEAVVTAFHDRFDAAVLFADLPGDWAARERERIRRAVAFYADEPLAPLLLRRAAHDGVVARVDAARVARVARASAANLEAAQAAGELAADLDPELTGAMLMGGVRAVLARATAEDGAVDREHVADELWRLVAGAVGVRR